MTHISEYPKSDTLLARKQVSKGLREPVLLTFALCLLAALFNIIPKRGYSVVAIACIPASGGRLALAEWP